MKLLRAPQMVFPGLFFQKASANGSRRRNTLGHRNRLLWRAARARLATALSQSVGYSRINLVLFGLVAVGTHPLFYVYWNFVYPQPFESLWLRLFSAALGIPLLFEPKLSRSVRWRRILPVYWLAMALYQLPFFFVFMSLMNGFTTVWALSTMAACVFLVLLVADWLLAALIAIMGTGAAYLCFMATGDPLAAGSATFAKLAPVYVFALVVGSIFNYKTEMVANEKLAAITAAVGTIAHELRTPLLGIQSGAKGVQRYFPAILEGYELARAHGLPVQSVRSAHFWEIQSVLERITAETEYSSVILDMLLTNSSRTEIDRSDFDIHSIDACIATALARYPFQNAWQRERVRWDRGVDFQFLGSQVLMVHVLFNLLKNALYFLDSVADGHIYISAEHFGPSVGRLHFLDTGPGIAPGDLPQIFKRFYSGMPASQGTGIGLAFARLAMHSFEGDIFCRSEPGRFTEFVMTFPTVEHNEDH